MITPIVLGFYGFSSSGKTTILTDLIKQLTQRGYKVGTIKQMDKALSIDTPGKDTWKHKEAGADMVVFSSQNETSFIIPDQLNQSTIIKHMTQMQGLDIIFIEGVQDPSIPKIRIGDKPIRENTLFTYDGDFNNLLDHILEKLKRSNV